MLCLNSRNCTFFEPPCVRVGQRLTEPSVVALETDNAGVLDFIFRSTERGSVLWCFTVDLQQGKAAQRKNVEKRTTVPAK